ncbi:hypothetical protein MTR_7g015270 [Medicago truncatula]|uniref:Uncharacterized protein n=1 Tax=Medicago truncatula TaxID=3880 RepID=A0A072TW76_MEDTR|nr:hypothetical protein MTR_7g015270 [Medicago truncatula]
MKCLLARSDCCILKSTSYETNNIGGNKWDTKSLTNSIFAPRNWVFFNGRGAKRKRSWVGVVVLPWNLRVECATLQTLMFKSQFFQETLATADVLRRCLYWRQRAKAHLYKDGDRNTKFFHASATARKKLNRITSLDDDVGNKVTSEQGLQEVAQNYFVNIFQQQDSDFSSVIDVINPSISVHDYIILTTPFTKAEFRDAIFSMHPDKYSGPDGYSPGFYQYFWNLCSDDIFRNVVVG